MVLSVLTSTLTIWKNVLFSLLALSRRLSQSVVFGIVVVVFAYDMNPLVLPMGHQGRWQDKMCLGVQTWEDDICITPEKIRTFKTMPQMLPFCFQNTCQVKGAF